MEIIFIEFNETNWCVSERKFFFQRSLTRVYFIQKIFDLKKFNGNKIWILKTHINLSSEPIRVYLELSGLLTEVLCKKLLYGLKIEVRDTFAADSLLFAVSDNPTEEMRNN